MKVKVPRRYCKYLSMLRRARIYANEKKAALALVYRGLEMSEDDLGISTGECASVGEPDLGAGLLDSPRTALEIAVDPKLIARLKPIAKDYNVSESEALTIFFVQGLADHYLELKASGLYKTDKNFRKRVDEMPHEMDEEDDFESVVRKYFPEVDLMKGGSHEPKI